MFRSKLEVLAQMLEIAENGTTKTEITSQIDMQRELVDKSLSLLTDLNLLMEKHNSPVSFVTTRKGLQFLHDYKNLRKDLGSEKDAFEEP